MLSYNVCFLITQNVDKNFGIARFETDDTLNIGMKAFMKKKEIEIMEFKFKAKTQIILKTGVSGDLNGCCITIQAEFIMVMQKKQVEK